MDEEHEAASARSMGFDQWDSYEPMAGGKGGVTRAWKAGRVYVVKSYPEAGSGAECGGARERAALAALQGAAGTPLLLAESEEPPGVVMEHLDGSTSVADLLLGSEPGPAADALVRWGEALAHLHAAGTVTIRSAFKRELAERAPELASRTLSSDFDSAADRYAAVLADLGLGHHRQALDELRELPMTLSDQGHDVLSPADACPDNNLITDDAVVLIDFEHAELRHRAWDVAYLQAPWPSCWCAWLLPDDIAAAAVRSYRQAAGIESTDRQFDLDLSRPPWGGRP